jgi:hypothetical protein
MGAKGVLFVGRFGFDIRWIWVVYSICFFEVAMMRTPTNHEDNFMWQDAAKKQRLKTRRKQEIKRVVHRHMGRLYKELMEDFDLTVEEYRNLVKEYANALP